MNTLDKLNTLFEATFKNYHTKLNTNLVECEIRWINNKSFVVIQRPDGDFTQGITQDDDNNSYALTPPTLVGMKEIFVPVRMTLQRLQFPANQVMKAMNNPEDLARYFGPIIEQAVNNFERIIKIDRTDTCYGKQFISFLNPLGINSSIYQPLNSSGFELRLLSNCVTLKQIEHNEKFNEKFSQLINGVDNE